MNSMRDERRETGLYGIGKTNYFSQDEESHKLIHLVRDHTERKSKKKNYSNLLHEKYSTGY